MQTTRKCCPIHPWVYMGKTVEVATKPNSDGYDRVRKWMKVTYHCRVCRGKEELEKSKARIPKRMY